MEKITDNQSKPNCMACKHCHARVSPGESTLQFVCRLNPPVLATQAIPTGQQSVIFVQQSCWPLVSDADICGKFDAKLH